MSAFTLNIVINEPIDVVVKALTNPDNFPFWQKDLERFEVVKGKPGEIGSIGHLHFSQKGHSYIMEDKMIYCDPGFLYVSQVTGDFITAQVETKLHSMEDQTEMSVTWTGKGKTIFLKLFLPLLIGKMKKQSEAELVTFKKLVETKGYDFSGKSNKTFPDYIFALASSKWKLLKNSLQH